MNPHRLKWTAEVDAEMYALLDQQKTTRQVAEFLSAKYGVEVTRNMVIGRRYRKQPRPRRLKVDLFGKSLDELQDKDCRYPHGEGLPYRFCGKPHKAGSSYCEHHHSIVWKPAEKPNPTTAFKAGRPRHLQARAA